MPMSDYMRGLREAVGTVLLEVPAVSIVLRDDEGRVLLVEHANDGRWVTPGGAVEPLETPADAAVREMWEETGLFVELTGVIGVYGGPEFVVTYRNGDRTSYLMVVFEARAVSGEARPDEVETLDVRFFSAAEVREIDRPAWLDEILSDAYSAAPAARFRRSAWSPPTAA